jgi:hypothetical protein
MLPEDDFENDARHFVSDSPGAAELIRGLRSCASPFIRAAIIYCACTAEDVPFLVRIRGNQGDRQDQYRACGSLRQRQGHRLVT